MNRKWEGETTPQVIYTIMPDYGRAYGWRKREESRDVGRNMADDTGWYGDHPISRSLHEAFVTWQDRFERAEWIGVEVTPNFDWDGFHRDGIALARDLKEELGKSVRVFYEKPIEDPNRTLEERREVLSGGGLLVLNVQGS